MVQVLNQPLGEILGQYYWEVIPGIDERLDEYLAAREQEALARESWIVSLGDRWFDVAIDLVVKDGQVTGTVQVLTDITELKRAERTLVEYAEQLRDLSARLADIQETERKRIAHELHDQVGQNLTALGINLNVLRAYLVEAPESALACLNDSLVLVKETTHRVRDVMSELRPPELDDYGLLAALRWYTDLVASRTGLVIAVQGEEPDPRLPSQYETALFRIAQEALTNVARHSQAAQVTVTVRIEEDSVHMIIADDGVGFDPQTLDGSGAAPHWGLLTMRERAQAIAGLCRIESSPGQGTQVIVALRRPAGGT
jgi:two-component system sensor histidine kinase UhpB